MTANLVHLTDTVISVAAHLEAELEEALAEHRLSRPSYLVLDALERAPEGRLGQRELVRAVRRTSGTMSVRLGRLERARMIEREPDPENRRSVTVTLTDRGRALVAAARPAYAQRAERLAGGLGPAAPGELSAALDAWLAFFEPDEGTAPRLGVAVGTPAMAKRMRSAVGLPEAPGAIVLRVGASTPAGRAGVRRGDLITAVDGSRVLSTGDLERAVRAAGRSLTLSVLRGADPHELTVSFSEGSEDRAPEPAAR